MKDWIAQGYPGALPVNTDYPPANGNKNGLKNELGDAADQQRVLLFPVFDSASVASGFHVIAWSAFVIDNVDQWTGNNHQLTGHFVTYIAHDLPAGEPIHANGDNYFGVRVITLTQ
jgi:hypothetical protein